MALDIAQGVEEIAESLGFGVEESSGEPAEPAEAEGVKEPAAPIAPAEPTKPMVLAPAEPTAEKLTEPKTVPAPASAPPISPGPSAPKTWRPEAVAFWDKIPTEARAEILKREEDMFKGLEGYKSAANIGKALRDVVAPHLQEFQTAGVDPMRVISGLLQSHMLLYKGTPEQRQAVLTKLAESYGVSFDSVTPSYVDPQVSSLKKTIDDLTNRLDTQDRQTESSVRQKLTAEVDTFAADPKNVYFEEVAADVAMILRSKVATTLQEAYEKAVWLNPVTRAKESARLTTEAQAQKERETKEKAEAATKAAAANVRKSARSGSGTAPTGIGTMESTMKETLAEIKSRG